jgi:hypothetical protein
MCEQQPSAGNRRGFFVNPSKKVGSKQQLLVRYYLWAIDGPWRLASRLHYDLMTERWRLRAGTKQKVLEVFARRIGGGRRRISRSNKVGRVRCQSHGSLTPCPHTVCGDKPKGGGNDG